MDGLVVVLDVDHLINDFASCANLNGFAASAGPSTPTRVGGVARTDLTAACADVLTTTTLSRSHAKTISRIRFLQKVLENSRVIDPEALPKDRVCLLSQVEFTNLATNTRMKFEIVSPHEMNLEAGKISLKSPKHHSISQRRLKRQPRRIPVRKTLQMVKTHTAQQLVNESADVVIQIPVIRELWRAGRMYSPISLQNPQP